MEAFRVHTGRSELPQLGSIWRSGSGEWAEQLSPIDGSLVQKVRLMDESELARLLRPNHFAGTGPEPLAEFCSRLHDELTRVYPQILEATQWETAFTHADCKEMVLASLEYVRDFPRYLGSLRPLQSEVLEYNDGGMCRRIELTEMPWGTVAAILPQSAFLFLAVTCLLNALATGNRVILRSPLQSARSAMLLGSAIERADPPAGSVAVAMISARTFVSAVCASTEPCLVHYLGSSRHAPDLLSTCFTAGRQAIIDGEGNAWVWVDEDVPLDRACDVLISGSLRYNGQTCTSINGAVIHPTIYDNLRDLLVRRWSEVRYGSPLDPETQVGPLQDSAHARHCLGRIEESGAAVLAGGNCLENLMSPTLASEPADDSLLVSEGLFGPALWITSGDIDRFTALWRRNRYPLCAGVLTGSDAQVSKALQLPNLARLVVNGDPSVEHIYEPWGGYPGTGVNSVGHWHRKYLRPIQTDRPIG